MIFAAVLAAAFILHALLYWSACRRRSDPRRRYVEVDGRRYYLGRETAAEAAARDRAEWFTH